MQIALALVLTIVSACALDLGYLLQHDVAARLPPLSLRRPLASVRSLLVEPRWLIGSGIQVGGFALYVVALALAPLALVQAAAAGGIGILAIMVSRITHVALTRRERIGAAVSVLGLVLLGVSLLSSHGEGQGATYVWVAVWLGASAAAAFLCIKLLARPIGRAPAWGIASGILFAAGDVATKMAVSGGLQNVAFLVCLIVFYGAGTAVLQAAFQRGGRADDGGPFDAADERAADRRRDGALSRATPLRIDRRRSRRGIRSGHRRGGAARRTRQGARAASARAGVGSFRADRARPDGGLESDETVCDGRRANRCRF